MEYCGYGIICSTIFLKIPLDGTPYEFLNLLFQILEHLIPKVLKLILQFFHCPIHGFPEHIFNQVPPI
jgi:hypothetical protein